MVDALKRAYRAYKRGQYGIRDLALVSILVYTGCRLSEALALTVHDLDPVAKTIRIMQLKKEKPYPRIIPIPLALFWRLMKEYIERLPGVKLFNITDRQARNIIYKFGEKYLGIDVGHMYLEMLMPPIS